MRVARKIGTFLFAVVMVAAMFIGVNVTAHAGTNNEVTVYYNTNWEKANIHYCVAGGQWTSVPGKAMEKNTENNGYKFKYTIPLGNQTEATICFNNGVGQWDSQNGRNYKVYAGAYGVKNGNVTKLTNPNKFAIVINQFEPSRYYTPLDFSMVNGKAPYTYTITSKQKNGFNDYGNFTDTNTTQNDRVYTTLGLHYSGDYEITLDVVDANGQKASVTKKFTLDRMVVTKLEADKSNAKVGDQVTFTGTYEKAWVYYYMPLSTYWTIEKNGVKYVDEEQAYYTNQFSWTPTETGTYQVTMLVRDSGGDVATKTMQYTVRDDSTDSIVVVYYKNNNWSNANIHFCVGNGNWTNVPGVKMEASDKANYTWKYVIDLKQANTATVCFNNGAGQWDSRNCQNYTLQKGVYGISNQSVQTLNE